MCFFCKHYHRIAQEALTCEAYPEGIPTRIIESNVNHTAPYKGDQGIVFEVLPGKEVEAANHIGFIFS